MPVFRTLLEPDAVKVARPVLRGEGSGNAPDLPDPPLVQYAYQCRFNTTPLHFPWPNRWAHSEIKIRSRLNERLKAIRYYREVVYQFFVRTRKVHQTQRLRQSLKILLTSSQDAAMTLSEHNFFD